ncbi:MAG: hypothetical protein AB7N76_23035 [Planctomycetota bacterium]
MLMVADNEITERIGVAAYEPFLRAGPYGSVEVITGDYDANERLAAAIRKQAARYDVVDVVLSVHTTTRDPARMQELIPPKARKLRLVYSTACYGNSHERHAWERLGARTVVTHIGINNPLVALPYFLSRWIKGDAVGETVRAGFREEALVARFAMSVPSVGENLSALYADSSGRPEFLEGSRPVISGDAALRITSGLSYRPDVPRHLGYDRDSGASLGLALRAMAGRYELRGDGLADALAAMRLPALPGVTPDVLRRIAVERVGSAKAVRAGKLVVELARKQELPLEQGFKLKVSKEVTVRAGRFDPERREAKLSVSGLWVAKGILRYRVTSMTVLPAKDGQGYRVKFGGGAWGIIPFWYSLPIGGTTPEALPANMEPLRGAPFGDPKGLDEGVVLSGITAKIP